VLHNLFTATTYRNITMQYAPIGPIAPSTSTDLVSDLVDELDDLVQRNADAWRSDMATPTPLPAIALPLRVVIAAHHQSEVALHQCNATRRAVTWIGFTAIEHVARWGAIEWAHTWEEGEPRVLA
jgi:hypothetical protein